ncbi:hypothetical protein JYU19_02175 [bacterium AH-315-J21]|nr:hypothetical protein [bacterium AH-315-J21]
MKYSNTRASKVTSESGFALLWALVVIAVVLISGAVVMKATFDSHQRVQRQALERRCWWLAETGVNRFLAELNTSKTNPVELLDIAITDSISENESITRTLYPWADVLLVVSTGKVGVVTETVTSIIGQQSDLPDSVLIRTRNPNYPLVLAGATSSPTTADGTVGLPVKVVSLGGKPTAGLFEGRGPSQTVVDKWLYEDLTTPGFDPWSERYEFARAKQDMQSLLPTHVTNQRFVGADLSEIMTGDYLYIKGDLELLDCTYKQSGSPKTIYVDGHLIISGTTELSGTMKLFATEQITVTDSVILNGIALISDSSLTISGDSRCLAHILSSHTIRITSQATLLDGSTVTTLLDSSSGRTIPIHSILIDSKGSVNSTMASFSDTAISLLDIPRIKIDTGTTFTGVVTSNHALEVYSDVSAQFDIGGFWYKTRTSTYINWLINRRVRRRLERSDLGIINRDNQFMKLSH